MQPKIKLVVGLGNPGAEYYGTRHNAGAWFAEALVKTYFGTLSAEKKFLGQYAKINIQGSDIHCLIPGTFMNRSGQAIGAIASYFKLLPETILVAHDELDIPVGTAKLKQGGGHGGHNGLRDTVAHLNSNEFIRLRLGIDHPGHRDKVHNYVLSAPSKTDHALIDETIDEAVRILPDAIHGNWNKAQTLMNGFRATN